MVSTVLAVAVSLSVVLPHGSPPVWFRDYVSAHRSAVVADRPLFLQFCPHAEFDAIARSGYFVSQRVDSLLGAHYVRVFIDTSTVEGRSLAVQFGVTTERHLVIVDRSGRWQVWEHRGVVLESELAAALTVHRVARLGSSTDQTEPATTAQSSQPAKEQPFAWIINVNEADFDRLVLDQSRERTVIVDFGAEWCGPCRTLLPLLEQLARERGGEFVLAKIDIDRSSSLAARYGVTAVPAVKAFQNGKATREFVGLLPESDLRAFLDQSRFTLPSEVAMQTARP